MNITGITVREGGTEVGSIDWKRVAPNVVLVDISFATKRPRHVGGTSTSMLITHEDAPEDAKLTDIVFETDVPCSIVCDGWDKWSLRAVLMPLADCDPNDYQPIEFVRTHR